MSADIISCKTSERLAGLWDGWESPDGEEVESCTILTTDANKLVKLIRNRMPVIVAPGDYDLWLDPDIRKPAQVEPLLRLYPAEEMVVHPVSAGMNNPRHDDPKCVSVR